MAVTIATTTSTLATRTTPQRSGFYANGRFWQWFDNGTHFILYSSTDGITWASTGEALDNGDWTSLAGLTCKYDGTYMHYIRAGSAAGEDVFYRRGIPNADGSITWSAAEQACNILQVGNRIQDPSLCIDSNGYPWISYMFTTAPNESFKACKAGNNDGTWGAVTVYDLEADLYMSCLVPLTDGKMYVCYSKSSPAWGSLPMYGKLFDGADWGGRETCLAGNVNGAYYAPFCAVAVGDNVYLVANHATFSSQIWARKRTYGVGWVDFPGGYQVTTGATSTSQPVISYDSSNGELIVFWAGETAHHIRYRRYNIATDTWGDKIDWIDESAQTLYRNYELQGFYDDIGAPGVVGLAWMSLAASPFNVRYDFLGTPPALPGGGSIPAPSLAGKLVAGGFI